MPLSTQCVTQSEAALLCGCDQSTIKRHRIRGSFPNVRRRDDPNRTYEIPVSDLVNSGLYRDGDSERDVASVLKELAEPTPEDLRRQLEVARAENTALRGQLDERRDEVAWLRAALDRELGRRGAA